MFCVLLVYYAIVQHKNTRDTVCVLTVLTHINTLLYLFMTQVKKNMGPCCATELFSNPASILYVFFVQVFYLSVTHHISSYYFPIFSSHAYIACLLVLGWFMQTVMAPPSIMSKPLNCPTQAALPRYRHHLTITLYTK